MKKYKWGSDLKLAWQTLILVGVLVAARWLLHQTNFQGIEMTTLASSIIGGGVFVLGLVIAGNLTDYREAERAPTDMANSLYAILREAEQMHRAWRLPNLGHLRQRLVEIVSALRRDIDSGVSRDCQDAIEDLSESFFELENSDVPANYIVRLRSEQAALRKTVLRIYRIQREEFLPSAYVMIVSFVIMILAMLMFAKFKSPAETLVTLALVSFFFLYLLRLLNVISTPFKVGQERSEDDVSLFLLYEFAVRAQIGDEQLSGEQVAEIAATLEAAEAEGTSEASAAAEAEGAPAEVADLVKEAATEVLEDTAADATQKPNPGTDSVVDRKG